ncbi:hypothetical protein ATL39_2348 [Sinobaca qinghaiensis]|uniref:Uncharacterized protein n=1 Tax=Sinobaca qinghaiensis TaxID=342944 RepID=A0A419V3P0_9BACL|nr:hypothetical protein [Sinobaca qinghaiensis]RKD73143.1 hypothetical protein ATL39_2348 [Sinobaca qinghaiensis]
MIELLLDITWLEVLFFMTSLFYAGFFSVSYQGGSFFQPGWLEKKQPPSLLQTGITPTVKRRFTFVRRKVPVLMDHSIDEDPPVFNSAAS